MSARRTSTKLVLDEDQQLILQSARQFYAAHGDVDRVRRLRDGGDAEGFSKALWAEMADLGWAGLVVAEEHGGAGLGLSELVIIAEEAGRTLAPEPLVAGLLGTQALALCDNAGLKAAWLPRIAEGEVLATLAYQEARSRYDASRCKTTAKADGAGWRIDGLKIQALAASSADAIIVSARVAGAAEPDLFLIPADAMGLTRVAQQRVDQRPCAALTLDGVRVDSDARLTGPGLLQRAIDRATLGLCAELLGAATAAFEATVTHLRERQQFGVAIGTFQVLQHRVARVFIDLELARSPLMAATRAADAGLPEPAVQQAVSLAKAHCSDAAVHATNEGLQLFGGVGMTDEYDIGLYMKHARAGAQTFGDAAWHRDRWATLSGY